MTKVGEQIIDATPLEVANAYTSVGANFDIADVLAKLGCTVADITAYNYADETLSSVVDPTVNDYWLSEGGYSQAWSTSPCCQLTVNLENGVATLLQMSGKYYEIKGSSDFPYVLYPRKRFNYYQLKFNFTLKPIAD